MFRTILLATGCFMVCSAFNVRATSDTPKINSKFQITCAGRATMTVTEAQYGLTTLMWPGDHFQIAAGNQRLKTESGDKVSIIRFRNGDRMVINQSDQAIFFSYDGADKLVSCARSSERENNAVELQRTDASGKLES